MYKVTFDWLLTSQLGRNHRPAHGREDAKFRWAATLPWTGLAKNIGQTVRHPVADRYLYNKLATATKKICCFNLHRNLLRITLCFDCFPVYSWKAKLLFPNTATIKQCRKSGIQSSQQFSEIDSTSKYCRREAISYKSMLTQWADGQNQHRQKLSSVHQS